MDKIQSTFFSMSGIKPRLSCMLGEYYTSELHPSPLKSISMSQQTKWKIVLQILYTIDIETSFQKA